MHGSASGPLGALLMIAPLAAIPIFAVVGVPQFASVAASPSEDEEFADLGHPASTAASPAVETPPRRRSGDDLFAPLSDAPRRSDAAGLSSVKDRSPAAPAAAGRSQRPALALPPSDALDQWEIRPGAPGAFAERGRSNQLLAAASPMASAAGRRGDSFDALQIPADESTDDGRVSAEGFSTELLKPDPRNRAKMASGGRPRGSSAAPSELEAKQRETAGADRAGETSAAAAGLEQYLADKSGWQAAARRLKELGIRKYRLESQIEEQTFVFMCAFAAAENPRVVRRFEADADNPLEAVQKVLEQIDEWRSREGRANQAAPAADDDV